jgi:Sodium/hydrogen exchanger family
MAGRPVRDDAFATLRGASCCRGSHAGQHRRLSSRRSTRPAKYCCCSSPSAWQSGKTGWASSSTKNLGTAPLAVILVEGGLSTKWQTIRTVLAPAGVVATVGVGLSVALTAVGAHALLGMSWQQAFLLGAILSSTDAAAVFAVLRDLPVPRRSTPPGTPAWKTCRSLSRTSSQASRGV